MRKRWLSILGLTVAGTGGGVVLSLLLTPVSSWLVGLPRVSSWTMVCGAAAVVVVLFLKAAWGRLWACLGVRHLWRYPPTWLAAVLGTGLFLCGYDLFGYPIAGSELDAFRWTWIGFLGMAGIAVGGGFLCSPKAQNPAEQKQEESEEEQEEDAQSATPGGDLWSYEDIVEWLQTDDAIDDPSRDMLDHKKIARRIVRRLASNENGDRPPTIAVIGPLGSGKTTIAKLVECRAKNVPGLEIVRLSLWQYDSSEAAVRGILSALIKKLGEHVNTWPLAGLRDEYVSLIEKAGGRWGGFARCLRGLEQPKDVIEKFGEIAGAVGISVVMWIEDMERFASREGDAATDDAHVIARLNPIRSLLHLLDQSEHISVIVADCSLDSRFDLEKIARYVERIPALDAEWVEKVFRAFRDGCLKETEGLIDPTAECGGRTFLDTSLMKAIVGVKWWDKLEEEEAGPAIRTLLKTPRLTKSSLRAALDVWMVLPGEIDLDIVLATSVIRGARPEVFAFFERHILLLCCGSHASTSSQEWKMEDHPVHTDFLALLDAEPDRYEQAALDHLVRFVFPTLPSEKKDGADALDVVLKRPQGFVGSMPGLYWQRYLDLSPMPEEESDQAALLAIKTWRQGGDRVREACSDDLVQRVCDYQRSDQIIQFAGQFDVPSVIRLLREVVSAEVDRSARLWRLLESFPSAEACRRILLRLGADEDAVHRGLCETIREFGHRNLPLMLSLKWTFPSGKRYDNSSSEEKQREDELVEERRRATVRWATETTPQTMVQALQDAPYYILLALFQRVVRVCDSEERFSLFEGWDRVAKGLLDAAEAAPDKMLPYVLPLFGHYTSPITDITGEVLRAEETVFGVDEAKKLFDFPRLRKIIAESEIPDLETNIADAPEEHRERLKQDAKAVRKMWAAAREACRNAPDKD